MTCDQIGPQLGPYVDGEAPPDARASVEAHVAACPVCAAEMESLQRLAAMIGPAAAESAPAGLWDAIESRLDDAGSPPIESRPWPRQRGFRLRLNRPLAAAAAVAMMVGLGFFSLQWAPSSAQAATVEFGALLDGLRFDPQQAFSRFLSRYDAREVTLDQAKRHGRALNFAIPRALPGGFKLVSTYALRFGRRPGVAARYERNGELLGAIFHPPVLQEDFGTHDDRECVVGRHRGHAVEVGEWSLVHLTDPVCTCQGTCRCKATCHCVLSRLDQARDLPAVMAALAPALRGDQPPEGTGTHRP